MLTRTVLKSFNNYILAASSSNYTNKREKNRKNNKENSFFEASSLNSTCILQMKLLTLSL